MNFSESNNDILSQLTIIITTYNRKKFLLRSIQYWEDKKVNIIYLDGSKKKLDLSLINGLNRNIKYIHNPASQYERISNVINFINTKYVMFGSDDEFYITSALRSCLNKLNNNPELNACGGICLGFNFQEGNIIGQIKYPKLYYKNLNQNTSIERINSHYNNYAPAHIYSVCRTDIWKIIAEGIFSKEFSFYSAFEFQFEFLMCFAGKTNIIKELMWLRSNENQPIRNTSPQLMLENSIEKWWYGKEKQFKGEYNDFIYRMIKICSKINKSKKLNDQEIEKFIEIAFLNAVNFKKKINYIFSHKNILTYLYKNLLFLLRKLKSFILYFVRHSNKNDDLLKNQILILKNKNITVNIDELSKIEKLILNFYK